MKDRMTSSKGREALALMARSSMLDADIESLEWVRIPKGGTLNVRQENKPTSVFAGFRDQVR